MDPAGGRPARLGGVAPAGILASSPSPHRRFGSCTLQAAIAAVFSRSGFAGWNEQFRSLVDLPGFKSLGYIQQGKFESMTESERHAMLDGCLRREMRPAADLREMIRESEQRLGMDGVR